MTRQCHVSLTYDKYMHIYIINILTGDSMDIFLLKAMLNFLVLNLGYVNAFHCFLWDVITDSFPNFDNCKAATPQLKLGHE